MNRSIARECVVGLLCLGLVLPGVGRAAQVAPTVAEPAQQEQPVEQPPPAAEAREVPGTQDEAPRRLLPEEQNEDSRWHEQRGAPRGLRILGEVGGGLVTSAALGLAGALVGGLGCGLFDRPSGSGFDGLVCLVYAGLGAAVGVVLGFPLGTWWAGEALGGNGSLLASLAGGALGVLAGAVIVGVAGSAAAQSGGGSGLATASVPVLGMAGCIIGYELSQRAPRGWAARGGLQPLLAFTPSTAVVGLSGHF
jgi:hypothetical protein